MPDRKLLTLKQLRVLQYIEQQYNRLGKVPTLRMIASKFELKAIGTVQDHLKKLMELGFLEKDLVLSRGFQLPHQQKITQVPILGRVPAGNPIEAIEDLQGGLALCGAWKGELFALRVQGDSMQGRGIFEDDFVIIRKQTTAEDGDIVVALIDQEATVKILEKNKGSMRLLPANSRYRPIELLMERENVIIGKVIAVQRML